MITPLFTTWSDYQTAIDQLLALAERQLFIYDHDLARLKLDSPTRLEALTRIVKNGEEDCLRIAVRHATHFREHSPRLVELLRTHSHRLSMQETPDSIAHLRDGMILADNRHALILFDQEQPRGKLLCDAPTEITPYLRRFDDIWNEGGAFLSATVLGL